MVFVILSTAKDLNLTVNCELIDRRVGLWPTRWMASFEFPIDKIIETDYIDSTDEVFTYDDLGNRLTLNNRAGNDVAYSHNAANEYTSIDGQSVWTVGWAYGPRAL